ncbi:hypothetical protein EW146_g1155 [Bondarzewia mesenterica]|uniref:Uncharacterized protein n=1 Tax=Bondarzewia mesenterica TaxID=1095465 RepID=A0A4S4M678_9AGAM|nr:hypothetical protein EW146_g1155 [Bondarzewia mesenterica]
MDAMKIVRFHFHNGFALKLASTELISPKEILANEVFPPARRRVDAIPFEARLSNDIRFVLPTGDFRTSGSATTTRRGGPAPTTVVPFDDDPVVSPLDFGDSWGIKLERRRAFSLRMGPIFDRRRAAFMDEPTACGVCCPRRGLVIVLLSCAPFDIRGLLIDSELLLDSSGCAELRLRSASGAPRLPGVS